MFHTQKKSSSEVPKRSSLLMCVVCLLKDRLIFYCHASLQRGVSCSEEIVGIDSPKHSQHFQSNLFEAMISDTYLAHVGPHLQQEPQKK